MKSIAVIDYGMGNLHSVAKALEHVAPDMTVMVTPDSEVIAEADRVVFPGVGAIRDCMHEIRRLNIDTVIQKAVEEKPVLAICVGLQALMRHSEENDGVDCLSMIDGDVRAFSRAIQDSTLKVPHMGWNQIKHVRDHAMWAGIPDLARFYFVHSYYVSLDDATDTADLVGECEYGVPFAAAVAKPNLFAAQCHPEKSARHGLQLLKNFTSWDGAS